ncbi:MAG: chemotaxis protein CheW [Xenococcaceae cyanobacterium]
MPTNTHTEQSKAQQVTALLKLVVFSVGSLNLALQIESVQKVINYRTVYSSGLNHMGVAHLKDREITVIDLHKRLFKSSQTRESDSGGYFIIAKNSIGEQFGILVTETPTLIDVPLSKIRALPESYRRADTLEIASHVSVIPQESASLTVFLLDADRLLPPF